MSRTATDTQSTDSTEAKQSEAPAEKGSPGSQSSNPSKLVPTRRMDFEASMKELSKHFAQDGDLIASHVIMALSAVFPDGEDYFVRTVRHYRDRVSDPALKRQVAGFIGQEAVHGREHRVLNDRLAELGYPTKEYENVTRFGLKIREKLLPAKSNLAATAALEHFTATLAELVLTNEEIRDLMGADSVRELFEWHALEESEHKAVAFDVYKAVGGSERLRVWTMNFFRFGFVVGIGLAVVLSLLRDRKTYKRGELRKSWKRVKASPIMDPALWRQLKDYNRPDFHPDDSDTTELVETWKAELFGENGTLNDKLTTGRAAA
jgi:predicted metal-dependent hydrolase